MCKKVPAEVSVMVDTAKPSGVLSQQLVQHQFDRLMDILCEIKKDHSFEIVQSQTNPSDLKQISKRHFGKVFNETHCFRGYPIYGSMMQFHHTNASYVLHLDCDMLFHEATDYSWIKQGVRLMEEHKDILCVLPQGGPPTKDGSLYQGTTRFEIDKKRGLYLFKNFTSRHYLIHRERFLSLLPIKPLWLSWREPFKSRLLGKGKMLCWEAMVERALAKSSFWRADLISDKAWSLHPCDRSEDFFILLPKIIESVNNNEYPISQ